jgi:hypothetical protein
MICEASFSPVGKDFQILIFSYESVVENKSSLSSLLIFIVDIKVRKLATVTERENSPFPPTSFTFPNLRIHFFQSAKLTFSTYNIPVFRHQYSNFFLSIPFSLPQNSLSPAAEFPFPALRTSYFLSA